MALSIARKVCLSSDAYWDWILIRHGFHTKHDNSFYLRSVVHEVKELNKLAIKGDIDLTQLPPALQSAISMVVDDRYRSRLIYRIEQLRDHEPPAENARRQSVSIS